MSFSSSTTRIVRLRPTETLTLTVAHGTLRTRYPGVKLAGDFATGIAGPCACGKRASAARLDCARGLGKREGHATPG